MVLKLLSFSKRRNKRRRRVSNRRNSQNIVSKTITNVRKFSKPEMLLVPPVFKNLHQQVTRHTSPRKFVAYHMAKSRNKRLNALRDKLKQSLGFSLTKKMYNPVELTEREKLDKFAKQICRSRKVRRDEIMRKTAGKGLKIKNAVWTDISKFIKCEKKRS